MGAQNLAGGLKIEQSQGRIFSELNFEGDQLPSIAIWRVRAYASLRACVRTCACVLARLHVCVACAYVSARCVLAGMGERACGQVRVCLHMRTAYAY